MLAGLGWIMIGAGSGALSSLWLPHQIFPSRGFRGVSLALAPLATGAVMKALGDWRRRQGKEVTLLATFWGGSAFAFALSLARLLSLRST